MSVFQQYVIVRSGVKLWKLW